MKKLFLLLTAVVLTSCGGDSDDPTPIIPNPSTNGAAYFRGSNDGIPFNFNFSGGLVSNYYYGFAHSTDGGNYIDYGCSLMPAGSPTGPEYGVYFENMHVNDFANEPAEFYSMFATPLPTNFLTAAQDALHAKGISVLYQNASGEYYYSTYGSQSGSTFSVSSVVQGTEAGTTRKIVTVKGLVSCKVYAFDDPLDFHTITGAEFKLIFRQYQD